ncbi:MAG: cbb3-type cytochrome oxidase subunit 3 [Pseudomonadales bacterium]
MDQDLLRGLATIFCMVGFAAVVYWAYAPKNKKRFEDDARLAFDWEEKEHEGSRYE